MGKILIVDVKVHREIVKTKLKKVNKLQGRRRPSDSPIRKELEMILLSFHIERASYQGGDLTGKNLLTLFENAEDIFSQFEEKLKESTRDDSCRHVVQKKSNEGAIKQKNCVYCWTTRFLWHEHLWAMPTIPLLKQRRIV